MLDDKITYWYRTPSDMKVSYSEKADGSTDTGTVGVGQTPKHENSKLSMFFGAVFLMRHY